MCNRKSILPLLNISEIDDEVHLIFTICKRQEQNMQVQISATRQFRKIKIDAQHVRNKRRKSPGSRLSTLKRAVLISRDSGAFGWETKRLPTRETLHRQRPWRRTSRARAILWGPSSWGASKTSYCYISTSIITIRVLSTGAIYNDEKILRKINAPRPERFPCYFFLFIQGVQFLSFSVASHYQAIVCSQHQKYFPLSSYLFFLFLPHLLTFCFSLILFISLFRRRSQ